MLKQHIGKSMEANKKDEKFQHETLTVNPG